MKKLVKALLILFLVSETLFLANIFAGEQTGISDEELNKFAKIYQQADYCVLLKALIKDLTGEEKKSLCGSVIELDGQCYILTVAHLQESDEKLLYVRAYFRDGSWQEVELLGYHRGLDVALLKFSDPNFIYRGAVAKLGDSSQLKSGDKIMILGGPGGKEERTLGNVIKHWWFPLITKNCLWSTAASKPGYSGGAIIDEDGEVVGIENSYHWNIVTRETTYSRGTKINVVKLILENLKNGACY